MSNIVESREKRVEIMQKTRTALICILLLLGAVATTGAKSTGKLALDTEALSITVSTNKLSYYLGEIVNITGMLKRDSSPLPNALVGIEMCDPSGLPVAFGTEPTGSITTTNWPVDFVTLFPCDSNGIQKDSFNVKEALWVRFSVKNFDQISAHIIVVTITLYDAKSIPLGVWSPLGGNLQPGESRTVVFWASYAIPAWSSPGNAAIAACVFTDLPENYGVPLCPLKTAPFEIRRDPSVPYYSPPQSPQPPAGGTYLDSSRVSPESKPGTYTVYVSTSRGALSAQNTTTFTIESAAYAPIAAFINTPPQPYVNESTLFDGSSSSPEGYNDTIVKYEWDFDDGKGKFSSTQPYYTYNFSQVKTYAVTLNVTDSEGLWSTCTRPVGILPPTDPKANFTWTPMMPLVQQQVNFSAANSILGWNGTAHAPIINYEWNFTDGNVTSGNYPTITYRFQQGGNYSVTLKITDSDGKQSNISKLITVRNSTIPGDVNGDGIVEMMDFFVASQHFGEHL